MIITEIVFAYKTDRSFTTYTYTVENHLEAVCTGTAFSQTLQMAAAYDGDGNRVYQLNYNPDKETTTTRERVSACRQRVWSALRKENCCPSSMPPAPSQTAAMS